MSFIEKLLSTKANPETIADVKLAKELEGRSAIEIASMLRNAAKDLPGDDIIVAGLEKAGIPTDRAMQLANALDVLGRYSTFDALIVGLTCQLLNNLNPGVCTTRDEVQKALQPLMKR
jgi:hypothetical protein